MYRKYIKRVLDFILSLLALIMLSPLMLVIGIAIKATSRGPVFFLQERLGKDGNVFKIIKFRTMIIDAEKIGGLTTTRNYTRFSFGIHAAPLIAYDLSDRFSITFSSDFLSLRLCALTVNNRDTGIETKTYHFDFNAQSAIFNSLGEIRIGIIYHFKESTK